MEVIVGDRPDFTFPADYVVPDQCRRAGSAPPTAIDDVRLDLGIIRGEPTDTKLSICEYRESEPIQTVWLYLEINESLLKEHAAHWRLRTWSIHMIGHGLGFGYNWGDLLRNATRVHGPGADTHFPDPTTVAEFDSAGGGAWTGGSKVPVENTSDGADTHRRGSVLGHEVMSGWHSSLSPGDNPPLSAITVQSMAVFGYQVDVAKADPYTLPQSDAVAAWAGAPPGTGNRPLHGESVELIYDRGRIVSILYR